MKSLHFSLTFIVALLSIILFYSVGPWLETAFWPVYSKFKIIKIEANEKGNAVVVFRYTKFRNCSPQGYAFYTGDVNAFIKQIVVNIQRKEPLTPKPLGTQDTAPFEMTGITPAEVTNGVLGEIFSSCHPLWTTRTEVFP